MRFWFLKSLLLILIGFSYSLRAHTLDSHYFDQLQAFHTENQDALVFIEKKLCNNAESSQCRQWQEAVIEFLYQYGEDLSSFQKVHYLESLKSFSLKRNEDSLLDQVLLTRMLLGFSEYDLRNLSVFPKRAAKLCAYKELLSSRELKALACEAKDSVFGVAKDLKELIEQVRTPEGRSSLFMFCRSDRKYPCMMFLKDVHSELVLQEDGKIWMQASLGLSRKGKEAIKKDGNTPMGVFAVNSVMPAADQSYVFGKFRRMILDFASEDEVKRVLPDSHISQEWWKEARVADEVGRKYLRIHGTGQKNGNSNRSYYPFVATVGCVSQREGNYKDLKEKFIDQRKLLDQMMLAQSLNPIFENETNIRSMLYVVNMDDQKRAVSREDVENVLAQNNN